MTQLGSKKSRKGCSQCKRRRVKCDESSPCANCVRRSEQCSLMYPASPMERTETVAATNTEDWLQDLELMHQYSHRTSRTKLGGNTNLLHLWQEYIPVEATRHSFLMHGVLALSALHIACSRPVLIDKYTSLCDKHQASALASYRHILTHITDDTANALFALATILSLSSVARATLRASQMPEPKYISLDSICELLYLTRGVREVKEAAGDVINRGPFSVVLFGHDKSAAGHIRLSPQMLGLFRLLERMIHDNCADPAQKKLCLESFKYLQDVYEATLARYLAGDLTTGTIWRWTALVSYEFIKLVQAEFPPALIITAHFVVLTLMLRELWYVADYGDLAYEGIRIALKGQLSEYLQWAEEQIASDAAGLKHDAAFLEIPIGGQDEYVTISRGMTPMIQTPLAE